MNTSQVTTAVRDQSSASQARNSTAASLQVVPGGRAVRVAFFGFYGRENFGDDLFGYILESICESMTGIEPLIVGACRTREIKRAFRLPIVGAWWSRSGKLPAAARAMTYVVALFRADVAIFGGGSLFGASASLPFARLIVNHARRLNRSVAALGVSVGPFSTPERERAFGKVLRGMSCIAVRDETSVRSVTRIARSSPVNLRDLAFALPALYRAGNAADKRRTLVVSIHLREYMDSVLAVLAEVDRRHLVDEVLFLSLDHESVAVTGDIARLFVPEKVQVGRFKYSDSVIEVVDILANASCVVTSKLHGAIVGFVYDTPVMLFCYQRKCVEFLNDNALPGPREIEPLQSVCVEHVVQLLNGDSQDRPCTEAEWRLDQFKDFIADIADVPYTSAIRDEIADEVNA